MQEKYDTPTTTVLEPTCYLNYIYQQRGPQLFPLSHSLSYVDTRYSAKKRRRDKPARLIWFNKMSNASTTSQLRNSDSGRPHPIQTCSDESQTSLLQPVIKIGSWGKETCQQYNVLRWNILMSTSPSWTKLHDKMAQFELRMSFLILSSKKDEIKNLFFLSPTLPLLIAS